MKKLFLLMLLCVANVMALFAEEWTDANGTVWTYNLVEGGIELNGADSHEEDFSIPSKINGFDIISIHYGAFNKNSNLTNISSLNKCVSIGSSAFRQCLCHCKYKTTYQGEGWSEESPAQGRDRPCNIREICAVWQLSHGLTVLILSYDNYNQ